MFTILHQRADGSEEMFQAVSIQHIKPSEAAGDTAGLHLCAGPDEAGPGVRVGTLRDGNVFVMNEKGATVGRFYLNVPMPPPNEGKPAVFTAYPGFEQKLSVFGQTP